MPHVPTLRVRDLTTAYRLGAYGQPTTHTVLQDVTFDAHKGDLIAIAGPSGAGKTSLLLCIAGLLRPARGEVRWQIPRSRVAYVPAGRSYYAFLTIRETLDYYASAAVVHADRDATIERALAHVGLRTDATTRVRDLSDSSIRRLRLAHALVTRPRALVLDELLSGADSTTIATLTSRLRDFTSAGGIVIIAETDDAVGEALSPDKIVSLPSRPHPVPATIPIPTVPRMVAEPHR